MALSLSQCQELIIGNRINQFQKGKGKVCYEPSGPYRRNCFWSGATSSIISQVLIYTLGGDGLAKELNTMNRPLLKPGLLDLVSSTLTIRPLHFSESA